MCNSSIRAQMCNDWMNLPGNASNLPTCPPMYNISINDPNWVPDPKCSDANKNCYFNPGADKCIIYSAPNPSGATQQCCYKDNNIYVKIPGKIS